MNTQPVKIHFSLDCKNLFLETVAVSYTIVVYLWECTTRWVLNTV